MQNPGQLSVQINNLLHGKTLELSEVLRAFVPVPTLQPLDERLAACILGVRERVT